MKSLDIRKKQKDSVLENGDQTTSTAVPVREDFLYEIITQFVERRKALGLTQEDVDGRMGTAERLCSKWECGQRLPTSFNFFCWAQALEARLTLVNEPYRKG